MTRKGQVNLEELLYKTNTYFLGIIHSIFINENSTLFSFICCYDFIYFNTMFIYRIK